MPDDQLRRLADEGRLNDPIVLREEVRRMLGGGQGRWAGPTANQRRLRDFAQSFTEQWLGTRALGREFKPDPTWACATTRSWRAV